MSAVVIPEPGRVEVREIETPRPDPFEALVRIEVCGLCGTTDRHLVAGTQCHHPADHYPALLGHEALGTVVSVGDSVRNFKVGDRVTRAAAIWPGASRHGLHSAWGGFAEYGLVRDRAALVDAGHVAYQDDYTSLRQQVAPPDIDPLDAALAISLSELASWMWKLGATGDRAIAVGGTGLAGYAICAFARLAGARPIIALGRRDERLERARRFGADAGVNMTQGDPVDAVRRANGGRGVEVFAEATGADAMLGLGLQTLAPGGTAAIYGAPEGYRYTLPMRGAPGDFAVRLIAPEEYRAYHWVCDLIRRGAIDTSQFRSHVWDGLEQVPAALQAQANGAVVKGLVRVAGT